MAVLGSAVLCHTAQANGPAIFVYATDNSETGAEFAFAADPAGQAYSSGYPTDVNGETYNVVTTPDGPTTSITVTGWTLHTVFQALGDLTPAFGFAAVEGSGSGYTSLVPYSEIANPSATHPPVVWKEGTNGVYFADSNPDDYIFSPPQDDGIINVYEHSGSILTVKASAATDTTKVNEPVDFNLDVPVTGQASGETLTYRWTFDDGSTSSQSSTAHKYLVAGTYDAYLQVTSSDDSLGESSLIQITVGKAPEGSNRTGGGTSKHKKSPTHGAGIKGSGAKPKRAKTSTTSSTTTASSTTGTTTTGTTTTSKSAAARRTSNQPMLSSRGPLVSGLPLGTSFISPTPITSAKRPGTTNPARTGHLAPPSHEPARGLLIVLVTLATAIGGALLEWNGTRWIRTRCDGGPRGPATRRAQEGG